MSTLTQFIQGDSFLGEYIPGVYNVWGANPTFQGKEYLATGVTKTYTSTYSGLATNFRQAVGNNYLGTDTGSGWATSLSSNYPFRFFYGTPTLQFVGSNYHKIALGYSDVYWNGSSFVVYGTSLTGSATAGPVPIAYNETGQTYGGTVFNGGIHVFSNNNTTATYALWRSTGTTYSNIYTPPNGGAWNTAASASLMVCISTANADTTTAGSVLTSTNGTSWTSTATAANLTSTGYVAILGYSTCSSRFIAITSTGLIWTSTDGVNWTSRTAPSGMPTSIGYCYGSAEHKFANSSTATVISVGGGKYIRTTDGVNFTLINLSGDITLSAWFNTNAFSDIVYVSPNFIIQYQGYFGYSSDDGVTFNIDYAKQTANSTYSNYLCFANSRLFYASYYTAGNAGGVGGATLYEYTGRVALSTPQYIGIINGQTWASGSNMTTFLRVK